MIMFTLAAALALASPEPAPPGHDLVWADEFDRDGAPDASKWTYDTHANRGGWYNNEAQYYSADRLENARVEDGVLVIEARRERMEPTPADWGGQDYTSARLISTAGWRGGFVETRAKLPCGRGSWPAIWMLPQSPSGWPIGGEIDIMEHVGHRPGVVHASIHTQAYNHVRGTQSTATTQVADACDAFHLYQVRWTADEIVFLVDDAPIHRFANDGRGDPETWPFDKPFHLILNIAVGGDWGGEEGVDDAAFPQRMEVDYVRVYRPAD
ncbi:MAG: glycoside hydrolase family 16 protein [Brevundimonas sp.]|nr:glycoside hydrolase family 16 protein [Brevundimonas sp.]